MKQIIAKEGMWLTQSADVSDIDRVFITEVCAPDDYDIEYRDATDEERQAWEERMSAMVEPVEEDGYEELNT